MFNYTYIIYAYIELYWIR